ncbi:hypothetical protein [Streptomyces sp. TRM68367]|uniref:hypothetical protein n=1 Tax=Streptomyces sp. TRM68367 TaxID=2758415 RepID=UPI0021CFB38E|nr:hypothetical protein [Streptomyces sp. TRM68367]
MTGLAPAINRLPAVAADDGHARLSDSVTLPLPVPVAASREVTVGSRPEDLRLTLDGVAPHLVLLTDPEVRLGHDERVHVIADAHHTHVFDAETGDSLR